MKNTRICSKCNSENVLKFIGGVGPYGVGNNIQISNFVFSAVKVSRYVCSDCGFIEEWVETEDLEKLTKSSKAK